MPRKLTCEVERVVSHGDRVYTVWLRPDSPAPVFHAGQFLHLALDEYDPTSFWPDSRAFSIASSPLCRDVLRLSYSARGAFTRRMEAELLEGRRVWIKMPYGHFFIDDSRDAVLFAGGTGITAFTAFLETLCATDESPSAPRHGSERSVVVAYGARTRELLIYRELVDRCVRDVPSVRASYFIEHSSGGDDGGATSHAGRVSAGRVLPIVPRPSEALYYISGPPGMLQRVSSDLRNAVIPQEAIRIDAWE